MSISRVDRPESEKDEHWDFIHKYPQCDHAIKGDDIAHSAIATGVLTCPKRDFSGPINLLIVGVS